MINKDIKKVLFLGPKGSYSDLAKNKFQNFFADNCEFIAVNSINKIMHSIEEYNDNEIAAVVPIENSVEGIVRETQDNLLHLAQSGIRILAETTLLIEHSLLGFCTKPEVKSIVSHPQALAQCANYINTNWDNVVLTPALSTSLAVSGLNKNDKTKAAIGNIYSADLYNIPIIEEKINDEDNNTTRFILLSKLKPLKSINNKMSIVFSTENNVGALNRVLSILEKYNLNMLYIDSRPSKKNLGEYVFYVDFSGFIEDSNVNLALVELQPIVKMFEILSEGAV